jgi:hypothetical protein
MEKLNLKKFESISLQKDYLGKIQGGYYGGADTAGGTYFWGYGTSTCDWNPNNGGSCTYYFNNPGDRWRLTGNCP